MNNTTILKKCLTELESETPRLDYLRGMLETLIELQEDAPVKAEPPLKGTPKPIVPKTDSPEGDALDAAAKSRLGTIKALAEQSQG